eukprot:CAMPEP_0114656016 /NCGR_PEP_ID=MMETSP0191-20121206/11730_1 /TAXON_ID=126664 /ORGANISM="Sorites sp." /LENGTH=89 /DNA_ID=CAMNT_0001872425 /DNA_START=360 /DNA_END=630 /DNA_ORIENTATION=-
MVNNGFMRVAIDRWGLIQSVESERMNEEINSKDNLSNVEYELEDHSIQDEHVEDVDVVDEVEDVVDVLVDVDVEEVEAEAEDVVEEDQE